MNEDYLLVTIIVLLIDLRLHLLERIRRRADKIQVAIRFTLRGDHRVMELREDREQRLIDGSHPVYFAPGRKMSWREVLGTALRMML